MALIDGMEIRLFIHSSRMDLANSVEDERDALFFKLDFHSHLFKGPASFPCWQYSFKTPNPHDPRDMKNCPEGTATGTFSLTPRIILALEDAYTLRRCLWSFFTRFYGFKKLYSEHFPAFWRETIWRGCSGMGKTNISMAIDSWQKHRWCGPRKSVTDMKIPNWILSLEFSHFPSIGSFHNGK